MEPVDRRQAVAGSSFADEEERLLALRLVISLYRECEVVTRALHRVACRLEARDAEGALEALERACVALFVADALLGLVSRECASERAAAARLCNRLLAEVVPELVAVRHELPGAAKIVRSILSEESRRGTAVSEALGRVDRVLGEPAGTTKPTRS